MLHVSRRTVWTTCDGEQFNHTLRVRLLCCWITYCLSNSHFMPFTPFVPSFVLRHVPPGFCAAPLHYGGMLPCRRVIFIEADPDTILASTFIYTGQRQHAIRCYAVPYGELCDVFEARMESGWESNVFQLYSTGRCGSTLLSKLLDQANSIVSISEPDVFSYVRVCCAVLCRGVPCCAVLCCVSCCVVLCCSVLCCAVPCCAVLCFTLRSRSRSSCAKTTSRRFCSPHKKAKLSTYEPLCCLSCIFCFTY